MAWHRIDKLQEKLIKGSNRVVFVEAAAQSFMSLVLYHRCGVVSFCAFCSSIYRLEMLLQFALTLLPNDSAPRFARLSGVHEFGKYEITTQIETFV